MIYPEMGILERCWLSLIGTGSMPFRLLSTPVSFTVKDNMVVNYPSYLKTAHNLKLVRTMNKTQISFEFQSLFPILLFNGEVDF